MRLIDGIEQTEDYTLPEQNINTTYNNSKFHLLNTQQIIDPAKVKENFLAFGKGLSYVAKGSALSVTGAFLGAIGLTVWLIPSVLGGIMIGGGKLYQTDDMLKKMFLNDDEELKTSYKKAAQLMEKTGKIIAWPCTLSYMALSNAWK